MKSTNTIRAVDVMRAARLPIGREAFSDPVAEASRPGAWAWRPRTGRPQGGHGSTEYMRVPPLVAVQAARPLPVRAATSGRWCVPSAWLGVRSSPKLWPGERHVDETLEPGEVGFRNEPDARSLTGDGGVQPGRRVATVTTSRTKPAALPS